MKIKRPTGRLAQIVLGIPSWVLRIFFLIALVFFVMGGLKYCEGGSDQPSSTQAPWVVQTYLYTDNFTQRIPDRFYLGKEYATIDGVPALKGYWEYDGKDYIYHEAIKEFPEDQYGAIDVLRRTQ